MHRGFNVKLDTDLRDYVAIGRRHFLLDKEAVSERLEGYKLGGGKLDGSKLSTDWFPEFEADVFLSHAHADSELALGMAGYLKHEFGLSAFIDSCVWGYSNKLINGLDKHYCLKDTGYYDYDMRNKSTAHIHVMLSVALSRTIDNCECIMFLNTPESVVASEFIEGEATNSPWIFAEIAMTSLIKRKPIVRKAAGALDRMVIESMDMMIQYPLGLQHLVELTDDDLRRWERQKGAARGNATLDVLYRGHPDPNS